MSNVYDVSIIVPVYNVANYVKDCLGSIVSQSKTNSVECLIIDDCGTDNSIEQISDFLNTYKGPVSFKLLHHEKNKGLSAARNTGIREASGEYLYFLDSDDKFYDSNSLDDLIKITERYSGIDIVQGNFYIEETKCKSYHEGSFPMFSSDKSWIRSAFATLKVPESACNKIVRKSFIEDNKLYFKEGWIQEDTLWSYQLSKHVKSVAFCFTPTYFYRFNQTSIMHSSGNIKEAQAFANIFNEVYSELLEGEIFQYDIRFLENMMGRIYNAIGKDGLYLLRPSNKFLFKILYANTYLRRGNLFSIVLSRLVSRVLYNLLCINKIFNHDSIQ